MAFIASYRNTVAGSQAILSQRLAAERERRKEAERIAWEARIAQVRQADERKAAIVEARKAIGAPFRHTYRSIEERAMKLFRVTRSELNSNRRNKELVFARQFIMYWACRLTTLSLPQIGKLMGGRDHTTCLSGKRAYPKKRAEMGRHLREAR